MTMLADPPKRSSSPARPHPRADRAPGSRSALPSVAGLLGLAAVVAALVLGLLALTAEPTAAPAGVPVAGPATDRVLAASRSVADLALCAVVGQLLWASWVLRRGVAPVAARLLSAARWSAGLWLVATVAWGWATTSDVLGRPLDGVGVGDLSVLWRLPQGKALAVVAVTAAALVLLVPRVRDPRQGTGLLVLAMAGTSPLLLTGHAAASSSHYLAGQALLVHVLAVVPWVGGLLAAAHLRREPELLVALLPRYSALALACFVLTAVSGAVGAWTRLGLDLDLWASAYGVLLLAKTGCLLALGVCGALHRGLTLRRLEAGRPRAFLRLAVGELLVMGTAVALAVVLSRTSPPAGALSRAAPPHASAFPTVDRGISPLSLRALLTEGRADALVVTAVVALVVAYLLALRTAHADGRVTAWPVARVVSFLTGAAVVLWALCGGLGAYSTAVFSAQVGQLLALLLVAPPLLLAGLRPLLRDGSWVTARLARLGPADGVLAVLVLLTAVYSSPLLLLSLRSSLAHTLTALAALAAGILLVAPLSRLVAERRYGDLPVLLGVPGLVLVVHGLRLRPVAGPVAGGWFDRLNWWWADPVADQRVAALLVGGTGVALLAAALMPLLLRRRG